LYHKSLFEATTDDAQHASITPVVEEFGSAMRASLTELLFVVYHRYGTVEELEKEYKEE